MAEYDVIQDPKIREMATNYLQATCLLLFSNNLVEDELFPFVSMLAKSLTSDLLFLDLPVLEKIRRFVDHVYDGLFDEEQKKRWPKKKLINELYNMYYDTRNLEPYILDSVGTLLEGGANPDGSRNNRSIDSTFESRLLPQLAEEQYRKAKNGSREQMTALWQMSRYVIPKTINFFQRVIVFLTLLFYREQKIEQPVPPLAPQEVCI